MRSVRAKYNEMRKRRLDDKVAREVNKGIAMIGIILESRLRELEAEGFIKRFEAAVDKALEDKTVRKAVCSDVLRVINPRPAPHLVPITFKYE